MATGWHEIETDGILWGEVEENCGFEEWLQGQSADLESGPQRYACEAGQEHQEDQLGGK